MASTVSATAFSLAFLLLVRIWKFIQHRCELLPGDCLAALAAAANEG